MSNFFRLLPLLLSYLSSLVVLGDPVLPLEHVPCPTCQMLHYLFCRSDLGRDVLDGPVRNGVREAVYLPVQPDLLARYVISRPNLGGYHGCAHVDEQ